MSTFKNYGTACIGAGGFPLLLGGSGDLRPAGQLTYTLSQAAPFSLGGFAFGAVAESFVGLGVVDIVWRAMLLGWLFGLLHRYTARNSSRFWVVLFCLWMTVFSYLCFRVSTFTPFARMVYHFAPAYLSVGLVMVVLRSVVMKARGLNPAGVVAR